MTSPISPRRPVVREPLSRLHVLGLAICVLAAFVARVGVRLLSGPDEYRMGAYDFYLRIAQTWVEGFGFCVEPSFQCSLRMPLYPMLLAPFVATGRLYPWLVVLQAAMGAALVLVAWAMARPLFGHRAALVAAVLAAVNPYAVVHDTALQDTVLVNLLVGLGSLVLLHAGRTRRESLGEAGYWLSGALLGLAVMTTGRVALLLPAAGLWVLVSGRHSLSTALRNAILVALPATLLIGGWVVRNWTLTGAPVLTTESGESLWAANNAWTFDYLPTRSIDLAVGRSYTELQGAELEAFRPLIGYELKSDRFLGQLGWTWIRQHPSTAAWRAVRKVWMPLNGRISPARGASDSFGYAAFFMPVHLAAFVGLVSAWRRSAAHQMMPYLLAGFLVTTAVYWSHTSHKSLIDVWLFVYAAGAVSAAWGRGRRTESGG